MAALLQRGGSESFPRLELEAALGLRARLWRAGGIGMGSFLERSRERRGGKGWLLPLVFPLFLLSGCAPGAHDGETLARGDVAFARGDLEEALAEYRLALRQGADDADTHLRVAHTYSRLGRADVARDHYLEAIRRDPAAADQAVSDLVRLARESEERRDRLRVAQAVQTVLEIRPGVGVTDLAQPLARHYASTGEYARALPFYQRALGGANTSTRSELLREMAVAHEQIGDCSRALVFYEEHRETLPAWQRASVDHSIGNCSFEVGLQARRAGNDQEALRHFRTVVSLGEPRTQLPRVYFEMGEILSLQGSCDEAVAAYRRVREVDPSGNSPLVGRAQDRIDQIRFGSRSRFGPPGAC